MLTMVQVNNKNTRTMSCCICFQLLTHTDESIFFIVKFEHVFVSWVRDEVHKTT